MTTIDYTATLTAPLHHGAGTSGNTSLLRTEDVITPDGATVSVPYVSGNSLRNRLRSALAWHLADTLDIPPGGLSKPVVDLLWSGGAITHAGAQTDLGLAREVETVLPQLAMLGYSAGSDMAAGTLHVSHLILVCSENSWRLPDHLADTTHARQRAGAYRSEEFGTRHDIEGTPAGRYIATLEAAGVSTQMIYDVQTLKAGSVLAGSLTLTPAATPAHRTALDAALALAAPGGVITLGAKSAVGYGTARLSLTPDPDAVVAWTTHLHEVADQVLPLLERVVS